MIPTLYDENRKKIQITLPHFIGQGGQAKIFAKGKWAYKIFHDTSGMIPIGKCEELSVLSDPCFIKPEGFLYNENGTLVGYRMPFLRNTHVLCQIFTQNYRATHNFSTHLIPDIIDQIIEGHKIAHKNNILIVDGNELNYLLSQDFSQVYFIDLDCVQTRKYPSLCQMENIKDFHTNGYSEETDWFAVGITSFQIWTGLHPYKGRYRGDNPLYKKNPNDDPSDGMAITRRRMKDNISVYHPQVRSSPPFPLDAIPGIYVDWYKDLFVKGKRTTPPGVKGLSMFQIPKESHIQGTDLFEITEIFSVPEEIHKIWCFSKTQIYATTKTGPGIHQGKTYLNGKKILDRNIDYVSPRFPNETFFSIKENEILVESADFQVSSEIATTNHMQASSGLVYIQLADTIQEIQYLTTKRTQIVTYPTTNIYPNSTHLFPGCVIQDLLGTKYVSFFPQPETAPQIKIPELSGYRILQAKTEKNIFIVVGEKNGQMDRLIFRFDKHFEDYTVRASHGVGTTHINFAVLDTNVVALLNEDADLELFSTSPNNDFVKTIQDDVLSLDMRLFARDQTLCFVRGNKVYTIQMRKK